MYENHKIKEFEQHILTRLKDGGFDTSNIELEIIKFIDEEHMNCLWYGGPVAEIKYKGFLFSLEARGDINCTLFDVNNNELGYVKDTHNAGRFRDEMAHCLSNDTELYIAKNEGCLVLENNNWFEIFVRTPDMEWQQTTWLSESDDLEECVIEMIEEIQSGERVMDVKYFEDLMIGHLNNVLTQTQQVSPDDYDDLWLGLFSKTKELVKKADESYLKDAVEFRQEIVTLVDIYNDGTLMFPDLVKKALDYIAEIKQKHISPCGSKSIDDVVEDAKERSETTEKDNGNKTEMIME